ncbi:DsbA family protein [Novipirellula artificiosorum]|uniref:Uncharacterized protein n=1 Tax=Novipirellula artificiosorum TaxID=2528016 RepID=A0A5C6CZR3_9BACT|nr:DsbA family protein [Novipirellula artificiosorum]TWU28987.1 hypothetical protein Poly41_67780 [Novipirellula artificiosorum]
MSDRYEPPSVLKDVLYGVSPHLQLSIASEFVGTWNQHLKFTGHHRSCLLVPDDRVSLPSARFFWDNSFLFSFDVDDTYQLAIVLNRWLGDNAMPSALRKEFPWLEIGTLADYYEQGRPVEGEFLQSWDEMLNEFYGLPAELVEGHFAVNACRLLTAMRSRGYDRRLRAGQSLWTLILSRSRRHGLREEQQAIAFMFHEEDNGMDVARGTCRDVFQAMHEERDDNIVRMTTVTLNTEIVAMLDQLVCVEID